MHPGFHDEDVLGKVLDRRLVARLWPFMAPYKRLLVVAIALILPHALIEAAPGFLIGVGLNLLAGAHPAEGLRGLAGLASVDWLARLVAPPAWAPALVWLALLLLAAAIVGAAVELARTLSMAVMGQHAMRDLRRALFDHVQRLPLAFFDRYPVGRLVTRLTNDIETISEMFTSGVVALVADLVLMAFFAALLFAIHPRLALAAMAIVPPLALAALVFRWKVREAFRAVRVRIARLNAQLQETISGIRVVQLFAREARNLAEFARENAEHRDAWRRSIRYDALLFATVDLAQNLTIAGILWYGARLVYDAEIAPGLLFLFIDWMRRFFRPLMDLSAKYAVMQSSMASCERVFQLLDRPTEREVAAAGAVPRVAGEIVFDRVSFSYGAEPVLRNVSFRVAPGEKIAIVGPTGSGKTTILKLLERLYEPEAGSIRLDGVDLREIPRRELRRHLAFVLQDVFLFAGDLAYNVGLGRPEIGPAEIEAAARTAHADRVVARLPDGWGQQVRERGVNFSAGERQLLSFARALAQKPEILLLDEATSSVDTETEALIQDALHELVRGKTSIVVAHRLSTIQDVDRILVLHHGELREQGTHEELLARRGLYWRLYQLQYALQDRAA
jgi:ABC-type multidrug transport system fused ATPase/permease subunit